MAIRPVGVREQSLITGSNDLARREGGTPAEGRTEGQQQGTPVRSVEGGRPTQLPASPARPNGLAQNRPQVLQPALQQNMQALLANPNTLPVLSQQAALANFLTPNVSLPTPPIGVNPGTGPQPAQPAKPVPQGANTGVNSANNILSRLIRGG